MVTFEESNMVFSFPDEDVYRIEKSQLLAEVQLKAAECVVRRQDMILFIEAKASSPRPQTEHKFDKFIDEITGKFSHSLTFYNATILRHEGESMPVHVKNVDLSEAHYSFVLVIYGHKIEWLPPLMDALKSRLRHTLKLWNIPDVAVKVMNERMAFDCQIIAKYN